MALKFAKWGNQFIKTNDGKFYNINPFLVDLMAYWKLDEISDVSAHDSHKSYDGKLTNSPTQNQLGKIGTSYLFDASSDEKIYCGTTLGNIGLSDFSFSIWVCPSFGPHGVITNFYSIIGKYTGGAPDYYLRVTTNDVYEFRWRPTSTVRSTFSTTSASDGIWHHVVYTADRDGKATIYVNAIAEASTDISADVAVNLKNNQQFVFGGRYGSGDAYTSWNGRVDEVGIWYRVLTPNEVLTLYNNGSGLTYPFSTT